MPSYRREVANINGRVIEKAWQDGELVVYNVNGISQLRAIAERNRIESAIAEAREEARNQVSRIQDKADERVSAAEERERKAREEANQLKLEKRKSEKLQKALLDKAKFEAQKQHESDKHKIHLLEEKIAIQDELIHKFLDDVELSGTSSSYDDYGHH